MSSKIPINVMFVEDDESAIKLFSESMKLWRVINPVVSYKTADEAWQVLKAAPKNELPDVLFLDRNLSGSAMQGDDLLKNLVSDIRYQDINIAMMTSGISDISLVDQYYDANVKAFFDKPISKADFRDFMEKLMFEIQYLKPNKIINN